MSTKTKTILRHILTGVVALYVVFLLGPIAGFDVPTIAKTIQANPIQLVQFLIIGTRKRRHPGNHRPRLYAWCTASLN